MSKYSFEFKLKVVKDYLSEKGGDRFLSNKYGILDFKQVQKWGYFVPGTWSYRITKEGSLHFQASDKVPLRI